MKILVLSDSHGNLRQMQRAIAQEAPDYVIHLGDLLRDSAALREQHPNLTIYGVPGNCDGPSNLPDVLSLTIGGKRLLITHGHRHHVKFGLLRLALDGEAQQADVVLFGHTHSRLCEQRGAMWLLNPGSCAARMTYGIVEIADGVLTCKLNEEEGSK